MIDRVLPLDGIHNFRDYGGYAARDGARLKQGVLWRSGQHVDASEDDLTKVAAIGRVLYSRYLFPFEITSILLLVAMVGAIVIAKGRKSEGGEDA